MRVVSHSPAETRAVAARVAELLRPGDLVLLGGGLGAGKTVFAQGVAAGLGVEEPVVSPTFTLVREYRGRIPVVHADVYRLDRIQEVLDLALEESFDGGAVTLVEWGDVVESALPPERLDVRIDWPPVGERGAGETERWVWLSPQGRAWHARSSALTECLFDLSEE